MLKVDRSSYEAAPSTAPRRVQATRAALLAAARETFAEHGFEGATITEIVERSGTSTGSLYNRFGGKENLFLELHREHSAWLWDIAHHAVDAARATPSTRLSSYLTGVREFLLACWDQRDLTRLFLAGGGPPGFDALALDGHRRWIDENADLLGIAGQVNGQRLAAAVTGVVAAGAQQVVDSPTRDAAAEVTDYYVGLVARVVGPDAD